jgi:hypothetical protein
MTSSLSSGRRRFSCFLEQESRRKIPKPSGQHEVLVRVEKRGTSRGTHSVRRSLVRKGQTLRLVPLSASPWFLVAGMTGGQVPSHVRCRMLSIIRVQCHPNLEPPRRNHGRRARANPGEATLQSIAASLYEAKWLVRAAKIQNTPTHPPKNAIEKLQCPDEYAETLAPTTICSTPSTFCCSLCSDINTCCPSEIHPHGLG